MNKTNKEISLKKTDYGYAAFFVASLMLLAGLTFMTSTAQAATFNLLTGQLDYGQTSNNVTNLQTFLASSPAIYPQGIVSGWFGPLTKSAVMNFQAAYGISQAGRVGPQTLAKINSLITSGVGLSGGTYSDSATAPWIYYNSIVEAPSTTTATVSWTTDIPTKAKVYYSVTPFQFAEAQVGVTRPTIIGGTETLETTSLQTNQQVVLSGLQSNTVYYYMIEALDANSNVTYILPATFTTSR
jgi:peptidoglycan hydrolase-like protein with peptidoglycan-binding domain